MAASNDQTTESYRDLVDFVVGSLLDEDTDYRVEADHGKSTVDVQIFTPDAVRGRVIGRGGRIARAMRSMVSAADIAADTQVTVDIVD